MPAEIDIRVAMGTGVSAVCATCKRFWEGRAQGLETCTAGEDCGSPIVGDTFHLYEGPITDFLRFCFVCGGKPKKAIRVHGHARLIGACEEHAGWTAQLAPRRNPRLPLAPRTVTDGRTEEDVSTLIPKPKKTLGAAMAQMEAGTFVPDEVKSK